MSEPAQTLIRAAVVRVQPFVKLLREDGWAAEIIAHSEPLSVEVRIDLSGLKQPLALATQQETDHD